MASDSQSQTFYAGEYRHSIDEKNRITVPSRWRSEEGAEFILLAEAQSQCLLVMSAPEFERMSTAAGAHPSVSARDARVFARQLHARSLHGSMDKQGRLVLPEGLCKQLGLKGEVALVGGRGRFEIWNAQKWKRAHEEETPTYQHVANVIGL
ncbi:MAG: division/cell wall cluster transcriptional repressor MraZ [Chthoniobacterales bacterium]